jgi:GTPase KRas protein
MKYQGKCITDDEVALVEILDGAWQEEDSPTRERSMRAGDGFLLVFSVLSRQSFEDVSAFQQHALRVQDKDYYPFILVGNRYLEDYGDSEGDSDNFSKDFKEADRMVT